jgi:hypothetical protein
MPMKRSLWLCGLACVVWTAAGQARADDSPSFSKQVMPFLNKYCTECHKTGKLKGQVNLESYEAILKGRKGKAILVAGAPDKSSLVLTTEGKVRHVMPPKKSKQPERQEIGILRAWVAAGAKNDAVKTGTTGIVPSAIAERPRIQIRSLLDPPFGRPMVLPAQ